MNGRSKLACRPEVRIYRAEVALEEQRLRIGIELAAEFPITAPAAELETGEFRVALLNGREEGMYAFRGGYLEVDIDVQACCHLSDVLTVVLVVGDSRTPVAVDG